MTDIVKRLREPPFGTETSERNLMSSAADEIERLRAENARLRKAFTRIETLADEMMTGRSSYVGAIRDTARAALSFPEHITIKSDGRVGLTAEPVQPFSVEKPE